MTSHYKPPTKIASFVSFGWCCCSCCSCVIIITVVIIVVELLLLLSMATRGLTCWYHLNLWPNFAAFLNFGTKWILVLHGGEDHIYYLIPLSPKKGPLACTEQEVGVSRAGPHSLEQRKISCSCRKLNNNSSAS